MAIRRKRDRYHNPDVIVKVESTHTMPDPDFPTTRVIVQVLGEDGKYYHLSMPNGLAMTMMTRAQAALRVDLGLRNTSASHWHGMTM